MQSSKSFWVQVLEIFAWVELLLGVVASFFIARSVGLMFGEPATWNASAQMSWGWFFITLLTSIIVTVAISSIIFVILEIWDNSSLSAHKTALILKRMEESVNFQRKVVGTISCSKCNNQYDADMKSCPHCGNRNTEYKSLPPSLTSSTSQGSNFWQCLQCESANPNNRLNCYKCGTNR